MDATSLFTLLTHFPATASAQSLSTSPITAGLINDTFLVNADGTRYILQRLHGGIFTPQVNLDIAALTPTLRAHGVPVPALLPSTQGTLWWSQADDGQDTAGTWRLMTHLPGRTLHKVQNKTQARHAAAMLGRFHQALHDTQHSFAFTRPGAHDTLRHMHTLQAALDQHGQHRLFAQVSVLAHEIQSLWSQWGPIPALPRRIIHGDPKISNLLFAQDDTVSAVLDLDTMAWDTLQVELGDAARSWCNPNQEDAAQAHFSVDTFEAMMEGYLPQVEGWITPHEIAALPDGASRICLELSARFAADALHESYFGWNPDIAPTRGAHNLLRAQGQLALAREAMAQRPQLRALTAHYT